jgi:hypothetical protein
MQSTRSEAKAPTTHPEAGESAHTDSTPGDCQQRSWHHCVHHRDAIAAFWVGQRCSACVGAWCTCFGEASESRLTMAQLNSSISLCSLAVHCVSAAVWYRLKPPMYLSVSWGFWVLLQDAEARLLTAGVRTYPTTVCVNLAPGMLTWNSTLHNRHPFPTKSTFPYRWYTNESDTSRNRA